MKPAVCRIVAYTLTEYDAQCIARRIGSGEDVGSPARAGECLPLLITRVIPASENGGFEAINGQLFIDGNFQLWIADAIESAKPEPGRWHWPVRELPAAVRLESMEGAPASGIQINDGTALKEKWGSKPLTEEVRHMRSLYDAETMARVLSGKLSELPASSLALIECQRLAQGLLVHLEKSQVTPS